MPRSKSPLIKLAKILCLKFLINNIGKSGAKENFRKKMQQLGDLIYKVTWKMCTSAVTHIRWRSWRANAFIKRI